MMKGSFCIANTGQTRLSQNSKTHDARICHSSPRSLNSKVGSLLLLSSSPQRTGFKSLPLSSSTQTQVRAGSGGIDSSDNISAKEAAGLRRLGWISFWTQIALSIVSAVVLFFTANTAAKGAFPQLPVIFNVAGVVAGFISTFLAFTKVRIGRSILEQSKRYSKSKVANDVLNATRLNLLGMGATIIALQSTVGGLVGKALTSSSTTAYNVQAAGNAPAALDVFAVQASTNTILLHFLAILFSNWVLRILNQKTGAAAA